MTSIDDMAAEIMRGLTEYADLADTAMKAAVKKTATSVKKEIEKQNEESRREIQSLGNIESGLMLRETEKLLHFIEGANMLNAYDEELFTAFVDSIIVYSRDSVGFKLKCGLTLKEALCTDTRL